MAIVVPIAILPVGSLDSLRDWAESDTARIDLAVDMHWHTH